MTEEDYLSLVRVNWSALGLVVKQTDVICYAALESSAYAIEYVLQPTQSMLHMAVEKSAGSISVIKPKWRTEALWLKAVKQDGLLLQSSRTKRMTGSLDNYLAQKKSSNEDGNWLQGITLAVSLAAVAQNHRAFQWIVPSDENAKAFSQADCMATVEVFQFGLRPENTILAMIGPSFGVERFFNVRDVQDHDLALVIEEVVQRFNTALLIRLFTERAWSNEEKDRWLSFAKQAAEHRTTEARQMTGNHPANSDAFLNVLTSLGARSKGFALLDELDEKVPKTYFSIARHLISPDIDI